MKKASRHIFISGGIMAWFIVITTSVVFAQNYSGIVPVEPASAISDNMGENAGWFALVQILHL